VVETLNAEDSLGCEGGGKGPLIRTISPQTLGCNNDQSFSCDRVRHLLKDSNA
jgi:hypothetical protein